MHGTMNIKNIYFYLERFAGIMVCADFLKTYNLQHRIGLHDL
jgi:hypothetical protein